MTPPSVPFAVWIWAAFDPILVVTALWFGWKADQLGKVFIAAIAALGITLLCDAVIGWLGIPWFAPLTREGPTLLPVRSIAALLWACIGYGASRIARRLS